MDEIIECIETRLTQMLEVDQMLFGIELPKFQIGGPTTTGGGHSKSHKKESLDNTHGTITP